MHVTLVAGAAGGIGRAVTLQRWGAGGAVAAFDVDALALDDLAEGARARGTSDRCLTLSGDVAAEADVRDAVAATVAHFGRLDAVVWWPASGASCRWPTSTSPPGDA